MVLEVQLPSGSAGWCQYGSRSDPPQERAVVHLHKTAFSWLCRVFLLDLFRTKYRIPIKINLKSRSTPTNPFATLLKVYLFVFIALRSRGTEVTYFNQTSLQVRRWSFFLLIYQLCLPCRSEVMKKPWKAGKWNWTFTVYIIALAKSFLKNPVLLALNMARSTCMLKWLLEILW